MGFTIRSASLRLIFILLISPTPSFSHFSKPKNVQTALRVKWSDTPLLLEAGELLSKEEQRLFWDFIDIWLNADHDVVQSYSAKDCVKKILEHSRSLLREPLASLFEFSLILRSASPALVLYRQLAHDSLSSFPHDGEIDSTSAEMTTLDPLPAGVSLQSPGGKCCWVDTGDNPFMFLSCIPGFKILLNC